ncbi:hypothetical protein [Streptomyces mayteni]
MPNSAHSSEPDVPRRCTSWPCFLLSSLWVVERQDWLPDGDSPLHVMVLTVLFAMFRAI